MSQRRKTIKKKNKQTNEQTKTVVSGTQTTAPIKQTETSSGPVGSVFLIIF